MICLAFGVAAPASRAAVSINQTTPAAEYRADQILIMPQPSTDRLALAEFHGAHKAEVLGAFPGVGDIQILRLPAGEQVPSFIAKYEQSGLVQYAEPDYFRHVTATPDDPYYLNNLLLGLNSVGLNGGAVDADIDAPEAWDVLTSASTIVVAVLDTGVRYTHEDLAANMWVNPVGGGHGTNAIAGSNDPADDNRHGSLMAGVLGAVGNNGKGVTGVAWQTQIMACKCFDGGGNANDSAILACVDYARANGAKIMNASFDGPGFSQSLSNAIYSARNTGIIFVASCGNGPPAVDVDVSPRYPACYDIDNIVSVAYSDRNDGLGFLSNYGATNVDLAAPGEQVYSTSASSDAAYYPPTFLNVAGTSYAAAYVSGAFALMLSRYPVETHQQIIARVLNATDPLPSLAGKCVTGGRLNLRKALSPPVQLTTLSTAGNLPFQLRVAAGPRRTCVLEVSTNLTSWSPIFTNTTSADGSFDFTDDASPNAEHRYFRAVSGL